MNEPSRRILNGTAVSVTAMTDLASGTKAIELRADGGALPSFTAGAHIDLELPNGLLRSYSLCNSQDETDRYVVAVSKARDSRGGSEFIYNELKPGDRLRVSEPRNNFELREDAGHTVLFAGGIGITPIWAMIQRLERLHRSWELHYSSRLQEACAFLAELRALEHGAPGRVHLNFDHEPGGRLMDLDALVAGTAMDAHLYCCGPMPMLTAFKTAVAAARRPDELVHLEYFTPADEAAMEGGFKVVLARSGVAYDIPVGQSILEVLLEHDVDVGFSCMEGTCRSCETTVLEGIPDHRDSVLKPHERESNTVMMVCCSGSRTPRLVLDL